MRLLRQKFAYFIVDNGPGKVSALVYSAIGHTRNQWVHLAGVDDGSQIMIYVDGQFCPASVLPWTFKAGQDPIHSPLAAPCTGAGVAARHSSTARLMKSSLYKRALSSNEIASIYNAGPAGKFGWYANSQGKPYLDTDQDGIPDFWEITFGQPPYVPSNNNPSTNMLGYTTLEEYDNWLARPHAVTVTNTPVGVDLQQMFGQTGHLSFFVTNAINGSVYLTNVLGSVTNTGPLQQQHCRLRSDQHHACVHRLCLL